MTTALRLHELHERLQRRRHVKTIEQGAATTIWCATSPRLEGKGGVYCEDCDIAEAAPADHPQPKGVRPWANDPALAEKLWERSEAWTGVRWGAA